MRLGCLEIKKTACLAPMAGVADRAMRELCKSFGAGYVVGEMASAKALSMSDKKTSALLGIGESERPMAVQLFGSEPSVMAGAAYSAMIYSPDAIDINMGCPAPKIAGNGGGCALMKNPALAGAIIRAVAGAVDIPVTVKIRKGWDEKRVNAVEMAKIAEACGAAAITVHGRTASQMYAPPVDMDIIRAVKQSVSIPVIGNGGIDTAEAAAQMYKKTGCDLVMVGRGAMGNPWIFSQINDLLRGAPECRHPTAEEKVAIMLAHIRKLCEYKGEFAGMREARKHCAWYFKGMRGAAGFRRAASELSRFEDLERLAENILSV